MLQRRPVLLLAVGLRLTSLAPLFQLLLQQCGLTHKTTQQGQCREFLVPVEFRQRQLLETSFKPSDLVGARWCAVNGHARNPRSRPIEGPEVASPLPQTVAPPGGLTQYGRTRVARCIHHELKELIF